MVKAIPANYVAASRLVAEGHWSIDYDAGLVIRRSDGKPYVCSWPDRYICIGLPKRADLPKGQILAHRLIWESVHGPLDPKLTVNHIDGNKQHNRLSNLEAVTQSENVIHAFKTGLKTVPAGDGHPTVQLNSTQALEIYRRCSAGEMQTVVAKEFGVGKNVVWRLMSGLTWSHITGHNAAA